MGVTFHWFKDIKVKIIHYEFYKPYVYAEVVYVDGDSAVHAYSSRSALQDLFMKNVEYIFQLFVKRP